MYLFTYRGMKKLFVCKLLLLFLAISYQVLTVQHVNANTVSTSNLENYIGQVYNQIDFKGVNKLSENVFRYAYKGYLNLQQAGKLNENKQIISICDFSLSSTQKRLWVIDLKTKKVLLNDYVAHGQGSGIEFATRFSNTENSHQSSLGFYVTGDIYNGDHGTSLYLHGMDNGYNSAAYQRAIVIHGADYVCTDLIKSQNYLGRSWGCPAVSNKIAKKLINMIDDGTCLFIYANDKKYLAKGYWLHRKLDYLPEEKVAQDILFAANIKRDTRYVYDISAADLAPEGAKIVAVNQSAQQPAVFSIPFIWKLLP